MFVDFFLLNLSVFELASADNDNACNTPGNI